MCKWLLKIRDFQKIHTKQLTKIHTVQYFFFGKLRSTKHRIFQNFNIFDRIKLTKNYISFKKIKIFFYF